MKELLIMLTLMCSLNIYAEVEDNGTGNNSVIITGKDAVILDLALANTPLKDGRSGKKVRHISLGTSDRKVDIACVKTQDSDDNPDNDLLCFIDLDSKF